MSMLNIADAKRIADKYMNAERFYFVITWKKPVLASIALLHDWLISPVSNTHSVYNLLRKIKHTLRAAETKTS